MFGGPQEIQVNLRFCLGQLGASSEHVKHRIFTFQVQKPLLGEAGQLHLLLERTSNCGKHHVNELSWQAPSPTPKITIKTRETFTVDK